MKSIKTLALSTVALVAAIAAAPASAITWNFSSDDGCGSSGQPTCSSSNGNTRQYTSSSRSVTASGWSSTGDKANTNSFSFDGQKNIYVETAYLGWYSGNGLGVTNRDQTSASPDHAMDNSVTSCFTNWWTGRPYGCGTAYDSVLLSFDASTILTSLTTGWVSGDSDFSVLYWSGSAAPALNGSLESGLVGPGLWQVLNNYNGGSSTATYNLNNVGNISSKFWLVSTYNSSFGICRNSDNRNACDEGDDFFKIKSVDGNPVGAPEPATLGLLGLGLAGLGAVRRRRKA